MPLVEFVSGRLDGGRQDYPCLDATFTVNPVEGRWPDVYVWTPRMSLDGLATKYFHETHDAVYGSVVAQMIASLRERFPRHIIEFQILPRSVRCTIKFGEEMLEADIERLAYFGGRADRPNRYQIRDDISRFCHQLSGLTDRPPEPEMPS